MSSENYKQYRQHGREIFDMIYDVCERAPIPDGYSLFFGWETERQKKEYDEKIQEYLELEKPKINEKFKALGFNIK